MDDSQRMPRKDIDKTITSHLVSLVDNYDDVDNITEEYRRYYIKFCYELLSRPHGGPRQLRHDIAKLASACIWYLQGYGKMPSPGKGVYPYIWNDFPFEIVD